MTIKIQALSGLMITIALALVISGCAANQQETLARDQLASARAMYDQAKADPIVTANAPKALMDAGKTLDAAEKSQDCKERHHLGYLAEREVQIAKSMALVKVARKKNEALRRENQEIIKKLSAYARSHPEPEAAKHEQGAASVEGLQY